ncbi:MULTISPECIES: hypothetical protein [unclassified Paenibacillus]|uniref:hypothetical protein n=1 Tax=unclassified Paenibacillus TaxID=185978 RepID=UPI000953EE81|nr:MULTISPECIES: hypothetical protein [unclassified Paenibacillus]QID16133.1 hypothetical protein CIC07_25750 [Paenibacillus sp. RUD330]SIR71903.1 hypothetical protein SAMN05880555_4887 [Paenibacillus sp. RU4X]SIR79282.1 hypothetical protein SAMN05880570_4890 [Paenibacillus sp. RU4T]
MDDMEIRYTTKHIADELGVEPVTVRKYALALEKAGYHIERSDGKNRDFSATDMMAFKYLQSIRSRTGITLEAAAEAVVIKVFTATKQESRIVRNDKTAPSERYIDRSELMNILEQLRAGYEASAAALSLKVEQYERLAHEREMRSRELARLDREMERQVERELREEAAAEWNKLPESERTIKVGWGWFGRRDEDLHRRADYIQRYVDDRMGDRLHAAYSAEA